MGYFTIGCGYHQQYRYRNMECKLYRFCHYFCYCLW